MDWLYVSLPFLLPILKIIAVIGAFLGLAERSRTGQAGKYGHLPALFLTVAIAAEVTDAVIKRTEANDMALRFARLARPLGSITIRLTYLTEFPANPLIDPYMEKLGAWDNSTPIPPLPMSYEDPANDILSFVPHITVFFYRTPGKSTEPDLSFEILPMKTKRSPSWWKSDIAVLDYFNIRSFRFRSNSLEATVENRNEPQDRYFNGKIASVLDLPGAQLEIRMCSHELITYAKEKIPLIIPIVELKGVDIEFPGRQELKITGTNMSKRKGEGNCDLYSFDFPRTPQEVDRLWMP